LVPGFDPRSLGRLLHFAERHQPFPIAVWRLSAWSRSKHVGERKEINMQNRERLIAKIQEEKRSRGLSWKEIAEAIGPGSPILYTAALLGQMTLTKKEADNLAKLLELDEADAILLTEPPYRGSLTNVPPTDPLIYRFYELVQTYGTTWKALIEEEFGDGIMSAIDFDMQISRKEDPKGDRVNITMSGKFLPFKRY
jgi:cyanate lyase